MSLLNVLPRLAPAVLRHLLAYGDLLYEETGDALRQWRKRAIGLAIAAVAGAMALMLGCVWIIAANWDGPHRLMSIASLFFLFLVVALIGWLASRAPAPLGQPQPFDRLKAEWAQDCKLIEKALEPKPAPEELDSPEQALHRVRHGE